MALGYTVHGYMDERTVNHISLNKEGRHSCYAKSPTAQDTFGQYQAHSAALG